MNEFLKISGKNLIFGFSIVSRFFFIQVQKRAEKVNVEKHFSVYSILMDWFMKILVIFCHSQISCIFCINLAFFKLFAYSNGQRTLSIYFPGLFFNLFLEEKLFSIFSKYKESTDYKTMDSHFQALMNFYKNLILDFRK